MRELAAKAGLSYDTARAVQAGNLQTGLRAYLAVLWAMGLESEFQSFADPERDKEGKQLEFTRLPQRVRHRTPDETPQWRVLIGALVRLWPFGGFDLGKPQDLLRSKSCESTAVLRHTPAAD